MKGQIAFEYIMIVSLVLLFIIPIWAYSASINTQASQTISLSQAQVAVNKIASAADLAYSQGPPTKLTMNILIPRGVTSANLTGTTVVLRLYSGAGVTDVAAVSLANLSGSLPTTEGLYKFVIQANATFVNISY